MWNLNDLKSAGCFWRVKTRMWSRIILCKVTRCKEYWIQKSYLNLTDVLSDITVVLSSILCILTVHQFYGIYLFILWFNVIRALVLRPTCHIWRAPFRTLSWCGALTKDHFMTPEEVVLHNRDHCIIILIFIHSDAVNLLLLFAQGMSKLSKNTQKMPYGRHFPKWPPCSTWP